MNKDAYINSFFEELDKIAKGGYWIQKAIGRDRGKLHRRLGVPQGKKIPLSKLRKAEHSKDLSLRREAILAETLRGLPRHHGPRK